MASPPAAFSPAGSPPHAPHMQPPRKRSTSNFGDGQPSLKRRKASTLSVSSINAPTAGHPLRQASFPPPESEAVAMFSRSPSVDSAAAPSTAGNKAKKRGRKPKSATNGTEPPTRAQTPSLIGAGSQVPSQAPSQRKGDDGAASQNPSGEGADEDEDPDANAGADMTVARSTEEEANNERVLRSMLIKALEPEQMMRFEKWRSCKLPEAAVKKLVNATVSQSVPANVALAVQAASKLFLGELVEMARDVQDEWIAAGSDEKPGQPDPEPPSGITPLKGGRRPPLRPDHLNEAYRRYKKYNHGSNIGTQAPWHLQNHSGAERFASRAGGRRLFR